jgi:hypothetical protein
MRLVIKAQFSLFPVTNVIPGRGSTRPINHKNGVAVLY